MKHLLFLLPLLLLLILSGCGHETKAHGHVIDQNGLGVAGATVSLDSHTVIANAQGDFAFSSLEAGDYELSAAGGDDGHYLAAPATVTIVDRTDNDLGTITAYRLLGIGVVVESTSKSRVRLGEFDPGMKEIEVGGPCLASGRPAGRPPTRAADWSFLTGNVAYVYLEWAPVTGATGYKIYFDATHEQIWESGATHPGGDPAELVDGLYRAYLDLDQTAELGGRVTAVGTFGFKVVAGLTGGGTLELPVIQVSLGWNLASYPGGLSGSGCFNAATHVLSWTGVTGSDGYRVRVYDEGGSVLQEDSGQDPLLSATQYDLSGAGLAETYHPCRVDAQYLDATGWPAEITRGIGGFTY